jgi:hypothetical protein
MIVEKLIAILQKLDPKKEVYYISDVFPTSLDHVREYMVYDKIKKEVIESNGIDNADPERYTSVVTLE